MDYLVLRLPVVASSFNHVSFSCDIILRDFVIYKNPYFAFPALPRVACHDLQNKAVNKRDFQARSVERSAPQSYVDNFLQIQATFHTPHSRSATRSEL